MMTLTLSNSQNHFLDTNVLLRHANGDSAPYEQDVQTILTEATGVNKKRNLWVSSVIFAELRPSSFVPGTFMSVEDFASYIRSIATIISLDPNTMLRVARLRDLKWVKSIDRNPNEKPRTISLGDAIHIVSALFVKEALKVNDLEFLTFDDGRSKNTETDSGSKSLSLLNAHLYTNGISNHPDVQAVCSLKRIKPIIKQASFV